MWTPFLKGIIPISLILTIGHAGPSFHIIAPSNILTDMDTTLAVHWFGEHLEINVTASITPSDNREDVLVRKSELFFNDSIGMLTLPKLPNQTASYYNLIVQGTQEYQLLFYYESMLGLIQRSIFSVFTQTDKITYRPGETVKFRVVAVDYDLRPYNGQVDIIIMDSNENIIHQWLNFQLYLGVASLELGLGKFSTLGSWKIKVETKNSSNIEYFVVDEEVLPKFDVTMKVPSVYIDPQQPGISGTVTAKYAYGKPVAGNVTVSLVPAYYYGISYEVNKTFEIFGSVNFSIPHMELLNVFMWGEVNITVSVTEELTGIKINTSSSITRVYSEYIFMLRDNSGQFIPGTNFTSKIKFIRVDQEPLSAEEKESNISVNITQSPYYWWYGFNLPDNFVLQQNIKPQNGIWRIEFEVLPNTVMIILQVEYRNNTQTWYLYKSYGMNTYIQIKDPHSPITVGTPFQLEIDAYPAEVEELFYVVMAKGLIVSAGKQNRTSFSLTPEHSWAPNVNLILYFYNNNEYGNIVQTSYMFPVKGLFQNKVTLSWSESITKPSKNVSLSINVKESHALVGLKIIDKRANLFEDGSNFSPNTVEKSYTSYTQPWGYNTLTDARISTYYLSHEDLQPTDLGIKPPSPSNPNIGALFDKTWIWLEANISSGNTFNLPLSVPDTMTSWLASAFVLSNTLGLGFTDKPAELQVYQDVSLTLNLPYSVIRGEIFILEVMLFNHLNKTIEVLVSVQPSDSFEVVESNNASTVSQQTLDIPNMEGKTCLFPIRPKILGEILVTVKAISKGAASDIVTGKVIVKAEGVKMYHSQSAILDLKTTTGPNFPLTKQLSFTFPPDVVEGSEEAYINIIGNLLIPSIDGLESLIQMPCGCGEQNMIYLAPDIYVLQYLEATNQATEYIRARTIQNMQQGYQNELNYRRSDGSFSAFGNSDSSGSTWLSAFVFRCFLQARPFIYVNPDVLNQTVAWLIQYQDMNTGIFSEPGRVIHYELQGGLNGPVTLTAYILTSLLEDDYYSHRYQSNINKAVQYLEKKFDEGISSNYTLSVVAYALTLANSTKAHAALDQLSSRATIKGSSKYWSSPLENTFYYWMPQTSDIETAAYALLSYYHQNKIEDGILVMKWLGQQRNHLGGFISTQDTIMALQALSKFMLLAPANETSLTLSVTGLNARKPEVFQVNGENLMVLQSKQIEVSQPLLINVTALGRGLAVVQLNVIYNLKATSRHRSAAISEAFSLKVSVEEDTQSTDHLSAEICTSYLGKFNQSGMAILEVEFVSGFSMSPEGIPISELIKRVETHNEGVHIYLDSVTAKQVCVPVSMIRSSKVASSQDALVKIYDYYNPSSSASRTYNLKSTDICDVCGTECVFCKTDDSWDDHEEFNSATSPGLSFFWFCSVLLLVIF
ncbi:CD109 antigen-like [Rana temporaria]|uniref:CD109 antigen-like n=1 Tax=Rana temporaria TaxID=8407 RepID=UPI001AADA2F5|nr:CD109 antigen-like [Rana temporaria]